MDNAAEIENKQNHKILGRQEHILILEIGKVDINERIAMIRYRLPEVTILK